MALSIIHLSWAHFVFLFLLFQASSTWSSPWPPPSSWSSFNCSTTWISTSLSYDHLEQRLAHRVSSIHQNQTRAFMTTPNASSAFIWTSHALLMLTGATNLVYTGSQGAKLENPLKSVHSRSSLVGTLVPHQRHPVSANQHHQVPFVPNFASVLTSKCFDQHLSTELAFFKVFSKTFLLATCWYFLCSCRIFCKHRIPL